MIRGIFFDCSVRDLATYDPSIQVLSWLQQLKIRGQKPAANTLHQNSSNNLIAASS